VYVVAEGRVLSLHRGQVDGHGHVFESGNLGAPRLQLAERDCEHGTPERMDDARRFGDRDEHIWPDAEPVFVREAGKRLEARQQATV
jgi:hypothetical protein